MGGLGLELPPMFEAYIGILAMTRCEGFEAVGVAC